MDTNFQADPQLSDGQLNMLAEMSMLVDNSPPPMANVDVGMGFHSWKKGVPASPTSQDRVNSPQPVSHIGIPYQQTVSSSAFGSPGTYGGGNSYAPPPIPQSEFPVLTGEIDTKTASHISALQPCVAAHPYDSSPFASNILEQCNNLASRTFAPFLDVAVGKDVHPCKEEIPSFQAGQQHVVSVNGPPPHSHVGLPYQQPITSDAFGSPGTYCGSEQFYGPSQMNDYEGWSHLLSLIDKVDLNSRVAEDLNKSLLSNLNVKVMTEIASTSASQCWEIGDSGSAAPYVDTSGATPSLQNCATDFCHLQHRETNKRTLPEQGFGAPFVPVDSIPPPQLPSQQSKLMYSKGVTCDCPNCAEARLLNPVGVNLRKNKIHNCHTLGCGKFFSAPYLLRNHLRQHTDEQPFVCPECGQRFNRSGNLMRHIRLQAGDRPFASTSCEKSFRRSNQLMHYERKHTGERSFACTICEKPFSSSDILKRHVRLHTGVKRFACPFCSKRFMRSDHLSIHVKRLHKGTGDDKIADSNSSSCSDFDKSHAQPPGKGSLSSQGPSQPWNNKSRLSREPLARVSGRLPPQYVLYQH